MAITRSSNFSVAGECKDPKELEHNQKERGKKERTKEEEKREGGPGPLGAPGPPLSFSLSLFLFHFDCFPIFVGSLHPLATKKFEIRVMALSGLFSFCLKVAQKRKPEKPDNHKLGPLENQGTETMPIL